jgi:hypothetical protein
MEKCAIIYPVDKIRKRGTMKEIDKAIEKLRKAMSLLRGGYQPKDYTKILRDYKLGDYTPEYSPKDSEDWSKK